MQADADAPNLREAEYSTIHNSATTILRIGEAVIAALPLKARIACCLSVFDALEERLEGALHPQDDVLQDLRIDFDVFQALRFQVGQFCLLLIVRRALALPTLPPRLALFQGHIIEPSTAPQDRLQCLLLWRCW